MAGHTGDLTTARSLLDDPDAAVRATALGALARAGALGSSELHTACADPQPLVRRRAAELLGAWEPAADDDGTVALSPLLTDADPTVAEMAAWATGERLGRAAEAGMELPEPEAIDVLIRFAREHTEALVREAAVAALGAIGDERGLPAILAATSDKATVRRRAVIALAPFEGPEVEAALDRALTDRDWQVRQAAEDLRADDELSDDLNDEESDSSPT